MRQYLEARAEATLATKAEATLATKTEATLANKADASLKADLHGTILSHATSLRYAYDNCRKIFKHVYKSYNFFRAGKCASKEVACDKIVPCIKSAFKIS